MMDVQGDPVNGKCLRLHLVKRGGSASTSGIDRALDLVLGPGSFYVK